MATIQDKLFTSGFNLGSPIFVQGGVNGAYAVSANQIAWGDSKFNGKTFDGTTVGLLTAIEAACAGIDNEQVNQIIKDYLDAKGSDVFATDDELNDGLTTYYNRIMSDISSKNYITSSEAEKYIDNTELTSALSGKADASAIPSKVSELDNDLEYITRDELPEIPEYDATTITDSSAKKQNQTYYISNIDVISSGNNGYTISYTFAELPSTEIVASNLWGVY